MRYRRNERPRHWKHKIWIVLPVLGLVAGGYLLWLIYSPAMSPPKPKPSAEWREPVPTERIELTEQRVYIPRLNLNLVYDTKERALHSGLWHRYPERGDPVSGGNFILAGHRFRLGFLPGETVRRSPLYHLSKIEIGDYIYADFNGKRYRYEVVKKYSVKPTQTEIEAPSDEAKMTLYSCTFKGEADGRDVLEAKLVSEDIDPAAELQLRKE